MNEIPNDEQITDKPRLLENAEFIVYPFKQFGIGRGPFAVAFAQALVTKLAQITFARFSSRHRVLWIFRTPKFKVEMATLGDFERVADRLGEIVEDFAHFGGRFEIQLRHITHAVFVLDHFASADAQHDVVGIVIALAQKMNVVCSYQSDTKFSRNLWQHTIAIFLRFHAVVVHLHEEIFRAKNVAILGRAQGCLLDVVCLNRGIDFARKATA